MVRSHHPLACARQAVGLVTGEDLAGNPYLGGGLIGAAVVFLGQLFRVILRSDTRWQRLNDAMDEQLAHAVARADAAEQRALAAEQRALGAEAEAAELRKEVLALRDQVNRLR